MRILLLLRGAPACGKSSWIAENGLKPYTLSADDIRLLYQSPIMETDGTEGITQKNDDAVWKTLFRILRFRMQKGEFTVIDATNSRTSEMNRYKELCRDYRYRIYCVDFTDIPIEEVKRRNAGREPFKRVDERVIDTMYARFVTQKIPSGIKAIKPEELDTIWLKLIDLSHYKKIHHFGDIHGCNSVLQKYLSENGGMKDDEMYIFLGDYIDRGIENAEVLRFLISIMNRKNVFLLEGNHEKWLWHWANDEICQSKEFEQITKPLLEKDGISKKEVRHLYRKFGQCAYYKYHKNIYLVTHAGLSTIPENLSFVATQQMTKGVGDYDDFEKIAETFYHTTTDNCYQIYGHRNTKQLPIKVNDRVYNLEGKVEYGGCLRCVWLDHEGSHFAEVKNEVYQLPKTAENKAATESSTADTIVSLRQNTYIREKKFGNISSFNYTDQAFYGKIWNEQTERARGLYLDTKKNKVAARAYDKFFNIEEREETRLDMLLYKLQFPVTAYVKENGFLGMVSYHEYEDDFLIACKSTIDSRFAQWLRKMLYDTVSPENLEKMKAYIKEKDVTFVFECIDTKNDPHIIEYQESRLVLLDIVSNQMEFVKYKYEDMCGIADRFGLAHKQKAYEILSWQDFFDWYYDVIKENYEYQGRKIEGFVIEDSTGYMVKLKLAYYNFWKHMRNVFHEVKRKGCISNTAVLTTPVANHFYGWVKQLYETGDIKSVPTDICSLRRMFYSNVMICSR